jgi:bis(5'-nucleosyl)-tetraphosphatase (symmetrical)
MATYAIGDIQGCFDSLCALLARCGFDSRDDRVWLAGDLVNRGPGSLEVLRWARDLGDRAVCVLGNHDLHLLARGAGLAGPKRRDTLADVLAAPDADELLSWLRGQPLYHREGDVVMVHAGIDPRWSLDEAAALAAEVEAALSGDRWLEVLASDREPMVPWRPELEGASRLQSIAEVLTRLRTCRDDGQPCSSFSGPPEEAPAGCHPWFSHPRRRSLGATVIFGHWAALGLRRGPDTWALDSGCVWGGELTALRLDDGAVFQQPAIATDVFDAGGPARP